VRPFDSQMIHQRDHVIGQSSETIRLFRPVAPSDASGVKGDDLEVLLEGRELAKPRSVTGTQAWYQDQGLSLPMGLVVQLDAIHVGLRHSCTSTAGSKPIPGQAYHRPARAVKTIRDPRHSLTIAGIRSLEQYRWSENYLISNVVVCDGSQ